VALSAPPQRTAPLREAVSPLTVAVYRPDAAAPRAIATAQQISDHAQRAAGIRQAKGLQTLRHAFATPRREAGVDVRTIQRRLGPRSLDTTTRYFQVTRQPLATMRRPFALLHFGATPLPKPA
jgi:site-specific recombinase XerD